MTDVDVLFSAYPKQEQFAEAALSGEYLYLGYGGAIRGGKTWLMLALTIMLCRVFPGSRWAVVRKDLPTLKRNVIPTFEKLRPGSFLRPINRTDWDSTADNGSRIIFLPESIDSDPELLRFSGLEVNGFVLEEAPELAERTFWKCVERAGTWVVPKLAHQPPPLVLATCNPFPGWFKRVFYDPWRRGILDAPFFFLPATAYDNPSVPEATRRGWQNLPERHRKRFVEGSWEDMEGSALDELNVNVHLAKPFRVPDHWERFGAFDWGYRHPFAFGYFAVNEDGDVFLVETVHGRKLKDEAIVERIKESAPPGMDPTKLSYIAAGRDCFARFEARSTQDNTPTTAERFAEFGIYLSEANTARQAGLKNLQEFLAWRAEVSDQSGKVLTEERTPRLRIMATPQNLRVFDALSAVTIDPNNANDALKVDADEEGNGGDDDYDMVRYGLASRMGAAESTYGTEPVSAWSPATLAFEAERLRRGEPLPKPAHQRDQKSRDLAAEAGF